MKSSIMSGVSAIRSWVELKIANQMPLFGCKKGDDCAVAIFVEASKLTQFHDEKLQKCTRELNAILRKYSSKSKDPKKELRLLTTSEGIFLAWIQRGSVGPEDEEEVLLNALGIQ